MRSYIDPELAGFTPLLCRDKRREARLPINDRAEAYPFPHEKSRPSLRSAEDCRTGVRYADWGLNEGKERMAERRERMESETGEKGLSGLSDPSGAPERDWRDERACANLNEQWIRLCASEVPRMLAPHSNAPSQHRSNWRITSLSFCGGAPPYHGIFLAEKAAH